MALAGLKRALGVEVRPQEVSRLLSVSLAYGLVMASLYVLKPVRNALFLDRLGIGQLPYVLLLVALVGGAAAMLFTRFVSRIRLDRLVLGTYLVLMAQLLVFWLLLSRGRAWSFYVFYVWVNLYGLMATSLLWLLANAVFNPREAKRLFGLVGTGGIAGAILGSFFAGWTAEIIGTQNLLLVCIALLGFCLVLIRLVPPGEEVVQRKTATTRGVLASIKDSSLLRLLGAMAGLAAVVAAIVDIQFNQIADQAFPTRDAKTAFFGEFFAYLSVFALAFQLLLTSRILRFLGVGAGLLFLPLSLAAGSTAVLFAPSLLAGILLKVGDGGFRYSIHKATTEVLVLPVPLQTKQQTKVFLDTTVDNLATGLGALLVLLLVGAGVRYPQLSWLSLGLIAVWVGVALRMRRAYVDTFRTALQRRSLDIDKETVDISDAATVELLLRTLKSPDERELLYALDLLDTARGLHLTPHLLPLLHHPSEAVRKRVLLMLSKTGDPAALPAVRRLLDDTSIEVQAEAVHYICMYDELPPMEQMQRFLKDPDSVPRAAAAACLVLHHGGDTALAMARQVLEQMLKGERGDQGKVAAARTLEVVQDEVLYPYLLMLLQDRVPAVVIQAIQSAGTLRSPEFIPPLIRALEDRRFRRYAVRSLACYGADAVVNLETLMEHGTASGDLKKSVPRVLGLIQKQDSVDLLVRELRHPEASLRYEILRGLNRLHARDRSLRFPTGEIREILCQEVRAHYEMLNALQTCCPEREDPSGGTTDLLGHVFKERLDHALERIFRLLGLLYPQQDIYSAYRILASGRKDLRPAALEFLDNILSPKDRQQIITLVDDLPAAERLYQGSALIEPVKRGREEILLDILQGQDPWMRACAVYTIGQRWIASLIPRAELAQADADPLVREAAYLALRMVGRTDHLGPTLTRLEKAIFLRRVEVFSNTTTQELARIAEIAHQTYFPEGAVIFPEGMVRNKLYLVVAGRIGLHKEGGNLEVVGPGESAGIWKLFDDYPHEEKALSLEETVALRIDRADLFGLMDIHPEIARGILKAMVSYIRRQVDAIY